MRVIFLAGPFRTGDMISNTEMATTAAINLINDGYAVLCPHLNSGGLYGSVDEDHIGNMYKAIIDRLDPVRGDRVVLLPGWSNSPGTLKEVERARLSDIPVCEYNAIPQTYEPHFGDVLSDGYINSFFVRSF